MADIHLQRIRGALLKTYGSLIDVSDLTSPQNGEEAEKRKLSRSLAAYGIWASTGCEPVEAAAAVTDGFNDGGLDAIHFNATDRQLTLCQSKWINDGRGSPALNDVHKFLAGVRKVINLRLDDLNTKIINKRDAIHAAVMDADVNIQVLLVHSGGDPLGSHVQQQLSEFIDEQNGPSDTFRMRVLGQQELYSFVAGDASTRRVSLEVALRSWGSMSEPFQAFYGSVVATDIAQWWRDHGKSLLFRNIREFKGTTDVNQAMRSTLLNEPDHFWYFNNGITLLCDSVKKKPIGGANTSHGVFECRGVSVVNGAQTVGQIGTTDPDDAIASSAMVLVRLISLEGTSEGLDSRITKATNTQNRIDGEDFASLEPNQRRIARELQLDDKHYHYKSGDLQGRDRSPSACTLHEVTIALACSQEDVSLAVQVKNQIGRIFDDLTKAPYTTLFNDNLDGATAWRAVEVARWVESSLAVRAHLPGRPGLLAVHGNRFLLHRVFKNDQVKQFVAGKLDAASAKKAATESLSEAFSETLRELNYSAEFNYLAPLFKNRTRCRELAEAIDRRGATYDLFSEPDH